MRKQIKDEIDELLEGKMKDGTCQVLSDYAGGKQRIVLEFYGGTEAEHNKCQELVQNKYPRATVYTTTEKDR